MRFVMKKWWISHQIEWKAFSHKTTARDFITIIRLTYLGRKQKVKLVSQR